MSIWSLPETEQKIRQYERHLKIINEGLKVSPENKGLLKLKAACIKDIEKYEAIKVKDQSRLDEIINEGG